MFKKKEPKETPPDMENETESDNENEQSNRGDQINKLLGMYIPTGTPPVGTSHRASEGGSKADHKAKFLANMKKGRDKAAKDKASGMGTMKQGGAKVTPAA